MFKDYKFRAGAAGEYFCAQKFRSAGGAARARFAYYFCTESWDFRAGAATARLRKKEKARKPPNTTSQANNQENHMAPQRECVGTHDLRRGFTANKTQSHDNTQSALRSAQSPPRPRNISASTRTISAPGSPRPVAFATKPIASERNTPRPPQKNARQSHRMLRWPCNQSVTHKSESQHGTTARVQS